MNAGAYPWYAAVEGEELHQGDILESCPVFVPPADLAERPLAEASVRLIERDLVVLSQTCDLAAGKLPDVLLCSVWNRSELIGELAKPQTLENIRKGRYPAFHLLAACDLQGHEGEVRLVDFRGTYTLPFRFAQKRAAAQGDRIRLLPPYREHLAQAFARFFMRVGLPIDIPPFTRR